MTLQEIKERVIMQLELEIPNWEIVKLLAEEAQFIEDNKVYGDKPKEKAE